MQKTFRHLGLIKIMNRMKKIIFVFLISTKPSVGVYFSILKQKVLKHIDLEKKIVF